MTAFAEQWLFERVAGLGRYAVLCLEVLRSLCIQRLVGRDLLRQLYHVGVKSQSVILITGAFTGMVLCAQTFFQFHKVRMDTATLAVVSVSMGSELGPVLAALMVAGRMGGAMAAELATMRVTEQIDALRTLAAHPVDYLMAPRVVATLIAMPLLTAETIMVGIVAAYAIGVGLLGMDPAYSYYNMLRYTGAQDMVIGLTKSVVFGGLVSTISCYKGFNCHEGAEGVGLATTEAVVYASIAILMSNLFLTLFLTRLVQLYD
jgi:phospholipid/cholesterol/gamma-HCH transport system permease protein